MRFYILDGRDVVETDGQHWLVWHRTQGRDQVELGREQIGEALVVTRFVGFEPFPDLLGMGKYLFATVLDLGTTRAATWSFDYATAEQQHAAAVAARREQTEQAAADAAPADHAGDDEAAGNPLPGQPGEPLPGEPGEPLPGEPGETATGAADPAGAQDERAASESTDATAEGGHGEGSPTAGAAPE